MAQKSKIRLDEHGLYFRAGGHVFRPVPARHSYPSLNVVNNNTLFVEGDEVQVGHVPQTPFGRVRNDKGMELWHSHGVYMRKSVAECWCPK